MKLWLVTIHFWAANRPWVLVNARDREEAKGKAHRRLQGNPDDFIVSPLTDDGDKIFLELEI